MGQTVLEQIDKTTVWPALMADRCITYRQ